MNENPKTRPQVLNTPIGSDDRSTPGDRGRQSGRSAGSQSDSLAHASVLLLGACDT
jgi:hypothetical protein